MTSLMSRQEEMVAEIEFGHIINEDKSSHEEFITFMKAYAILDSVWSNWRRGLGAWKALALRARPILNWGEFNINAGLEGCHDGGLQGYLGCCHWTVALSGC